MLTAGTVAFATGSTFATVGALAAGCALTLYVAFGFGLKGAHRKAVFTGFLVDFNELHFYFVTLLEA